jgi:DNA-binding transcriptional MerR regulator
MYFPTEHLLDKLQISAEELSGFEQNGIVKGVAKAGRVFYSSRDMYRLKGILLFMTRGLTLDEAQRRVDHHTEEIATVTSVAKAGRGD